MSLQLLDTSTELDPRARAARRLRPTWALGALVLLVLLPQRATPIENRPHTTAYRVDVAPKLDGRLDEPAWKRAERIHLFYQVIPVQEGTPSQRTEAWVLYDASSLYIGVRCHDDEAEKIIARRMLRDDELRFDDRVSINLDPLLDERNGYYFQVNSLGARRDALIENGSPKFDWDGIWDAAATRDAGGYTLEIQIPFQSLNVNPRQSTWGMQIFRGVRRHNEWIRWASPQLDAQFFNMATAGYLHGLTGIGEGLGLDAVVNGAVQYLNDGQTGRTYRKGDPGLDLFYRVTPSLSASFTTNTDFADAEVDAREINLSQFALFFPEKRRFFLQDAGIFDFAGIEQNARPFFSRRIGIDENTGEEVDIRAGAKLTGRVGPLNVGFLGVHTEGVGSVDAHNLAAARVSLNVLEESTVGLIYTRGDPDSNERSALYGADVNLRSTSLVPGRQLEGRLWVQRSENTGVRRGERAYGARLSYPNDRVRWDLGFLEVGDGFDPRLGFLNRAGVRHYSGSYRYRLRPQRWLRQVDNEIEAEWITDTRGALSSARLELRPLALENAIGDRLELSCQRRIERPGLAFPIAFGGVAPDRYAWNRCEYTASVSEAREVSGRLSFGHGGFYGGRLRRLFARLGWRPSRYLALSAELDQNEIELPRVDRSTILDALLVTLPETVPRTGATKDGFTTRIVRLRVDLSFTPDVSWNTFAQYDNVTRSAGVNSRLRWIVAPGREFFVVLNQGLLIENSEVHRGATNPRVKLSWLYRY